MLDEISSTYAARFGVERDAVWFLLKLQEELGELVEAYLRMTGQARSRDMTQGELDTAFRHEMADVLGHTLLLARFHGIDLMAAIEKKWLRHVPRAESQVDEPTSRINLTSGSEGRRRPC